MPGRELFNIKEKLSLGNVPRDKTPKSILTYKDGVVSYVTLDSKPALGSKNLLSSDAIYRAIRDGVTSEFQSVISSGATSLQNLQSATTIGNYTNRGIVLRNVAGDQEYLLEVNADGHLVFTGGLDKNAHFSGDVVAFSSVSPPAASWWDDLPVASASVLGGVKVGTTLTIAAGVLDVATSAIVDHGGLLGLGDDDHTQYHTDARGDARYSLLAHLHTGVYEPAFAKNTAFNKDFAGTGVATTISRSDHTHVEADITDLDKFWTQVGSDIYYDAGEVQVRANKTFRLYDSTNTDSWTFNVDANNHLIVTGPANANAHFSGDVVAFSSASPPAASWWDDLPVASATVLGGVKVGTTLTIAAGVLDVATSAVVDHGGLTGLADDDHTQYHNNTRGDARYSLLAHTHVEADITDLDKLWTQSGSDIYYNIGNVGLGTTSPSDDLSIFNSSASWSTYSRIRLGAESETTYYGRVSYFRGASAGLERLYLGGAANEAIMALDLNNSRVGAGTTSPQSIIHTYGNSTTWDGTTMISVQNANTVGFGREAGINFVHGSVETNGASSGVHSYYDTYNATNGYGGSLLFYTKDAASEASMTAKLKINGSGAIIINPNHANYPALYANDDSSYGNMVLGGVSRGGYYGMRLGPTTNATLMSSTSSCGIYWNDVTEWGVLTSKNGATTLYHNGTARVATTTTGTSVTGSGNVIDLIYGSGQDGYIRGVKNGAANWYIGNGSTGNNQLQIINYQNESLILGTNGTTRGTITGGGRLGWGLSSPQTNIHLHEATASTLAYFRISNATASTGVDFGVTSGGEGIMWHRNIQPLRFGTSDTERMRISAIGNVSIGNTSNTYPLDVTGTVNATDFRLSSDRRFKSDIESIDRIKAVENILKLRPVSYYWKEDYSNDRSLQKHFIAQEVEGVIPEAVSINNDGEYGMKDNVIVAELTAAMQQLIKRVKTLERTLNDFS